MPRLKQKRPLWTGASKLLEIGTVSMKSFITLTSLTFSLFVLSSQLASTAWAIDVAGVRCESISEHGEHNFFWMLSQTSVPNEYVLS